MPTQNPEPTDQPIQRLRACLVSVGGSPDPILHTLRTHRPAYVAYFCSAGTWDKAEAIQQILIADPVPAPVAAYLEVERFEELGPCYAALRAWLPTWLAAQTLAPEEVLVDYTGGTKTMSAALVLAATETLSHFSYVGGAQRDKAGTGIVIPGQERIYYQANPWRELAVRELDQAAHLWNAQQYDAAATLLRRAKGQVPREQRPAYERVILLAQALGDRLALQLTAATQKTTDLAKKLRKTPLAPGSAPAVAAAHSQLLDFADRASARFSAAAAFSGPAADPTAQLRELLDNAHLTSRLGRHDDAAARLYRALELFGQNELARLTGGAFYLGKLKADTLPAELANFAPFAGAEGIDVARRGIALEQVYRALAHLGHPAGLRALADFDGPESLKTPWRQATQRRNQSILGHGLQPVGAEGFATLAALVADYTGQDTTRAELDAPVLTPAWFS